MITKLGFDSSRSSLSELNSGPAEVSIIIAAKNEAKNLKRLIIALSGLNYPENNFEVIIVDDSSIDGTFQKATELTADFHNFLVISSENKKYNGKRGALDYGISKSRYPYILITDADCIPENNWLKLASEKFNEGYDFIFGISPFYKKNKMVNKISCFENFRNSLLAFAAVNLGLTYTASARNFGFKKQAFLNIGGYKHTFDTISGDDDLLLREAVKNKLRIGTLISPESFVYSESKNSFREYLAQRARHVQSSFYYPLKQKLFLATWHLLNIIFIISLLLIPFNILFLIPFLTKLLLDISVCKLYQIKFGYRFSLIEIVYLQIIYEIFLIIHFVRSKTTRVKWE